MKRNKLFSLAVCLLLLVMLLVPAAAFSDDDEAMFTTTDAGEDYTYHAPLLVDDAGLLTDREAKKLLGVLEKSSKKAGVDIVVVTKSDIGGADVRDYADDYYDYNGYGQGDDHDGALLLLSMADHDYWISTTGFCIDAITDYGIDSMIIDILSDLSEGNYYKAFELFASECEGIISQARAGNVYDLYTNANDEFRYGDYYEKALDQYAREQQQDFNYLGAALIAVGIGFALALVTVFVMRGKLKTVRHQYEASNYVVPGSLRMQDQEDRFLYASVSKTQIASDNNHSSGGRGGLSGGGSSVHVGSSGVSHGGGGGKF